MRKYVFALVSIFLLFSCDTNEDEGGEEEGFSTEIIDGGIVTASKIVTIDREFVEFDEYEGLLNDTPITIYKASDTQLSFLVPGNTNMGEAVLEIPGFQLEVNYQINAITLSGTPDEVLGTFSFNIDTFAENQILDENSEIFNQYIESYTSVLDNATDSEKEEMAVFYESNRQFIDDILLSGPGRGPSGDNLFLLGRYLGAVLIFSATLTATYASVQAQAYPVALLAGLVTYAAWKTAASLKGEFEAQNTQKIDVAIDGFFSDFFERSNGAGITLGNNQVSSFTLSSLNRGITTEDSDSSSGNVISYFESTTAFNGPISRINSVIQLINENLFFANIPEIPLREVPSTSEEVLENEGQEFFDSMNFDLSINGATTSVIFNDGAIELMATFDDSNEEQLQGSLNFSFTDEFNIYSGSFNVLVSSIDISGTWVITENSTCQSTNGDTSTDNGIGILILNDDSTVSIEDDSNGVYLTNNFTFQDNVLTIELSYEKDFSPPCGGIDFQLVNNSYQLMFDEVLGTFSGTSQSSVSEVSDTGCIQFGNSCNGTVFLKR